MTTKQFIEKQMIQINEEGKYLMDSRLIARVLKVEHNKLLRDIRNIMNDFSETDIINNFKKTSYADKKNQKRPCFLLDKIACDILLSKKRKTQTLKGFIDLYNEVFNENHKTFFISTRFEHSFLKQLNDTLEPTGIELEKQVKVLEGKYIIDAYIPQYNIAIEYDERHHQYQIEDDKMRENEIEKELDCEIIRLSYQDSDAYNVGKVIHEIIKIEMILNRTGGYTSAYEKYAIGGLSDADK